MRLAVAFFVLFVFSTKVAHAEDDCFVRAIGRAQNAIYPSHPWTRVEARRIGMAIQKSATKHKLTPEFIFSIGVNESDLNYRAQRIVPLSDNKTAIDGGLMGIRCIIVGTNTRCINVPVRGLTMRQAFEPENNIEIAAQMLANLRDEPVNIPRHTNGRVFFESCPHTRHPYWAHYNWGWQVLESGTPGAYPWHVAVIARAMMPVTGIESMPEVTTVKIPKGLQRTRYTDIRDRLRTVAGACPTVVSFN